MKPTIRRLILIAPISLTLGTTYLLINFLAADIFGFTTISLLTTSVILSILLIGLTTQEFEEFFIEEMNHQNTVYWITLVLVATLAIITAVSAVNLGGAEYTQHMAENHS